MTRQQAEEQAAQDTGGKGFLHLVGLIRESEEGMGDQIPNTGSFPEPEGDFGGNTALIDWASI